jgi:ABC-2 type transport system permease protein
MQYRASFIMLALGHLAITGIEFLGILVLFHRFGSLRSWELVEVAFMYGVVNIAFSISDAASRGFDTFGIMVKSGEFDRLLTRPRSTALQLAGQELTLRRVGRLAQGLFILIWASYALDIDWTAARVALVFAAVFGGAALFSGLVILQATLAFWTTETLEIMNTVTYGGVETTQYPLVIYRPWFRDIFIYVVPLATVSYFPTLAILGRPDSLGTPVLFQYLSPLIGVGFLIITLQVWQFGVRHYRSTGS